MAAKTNVSIETELQFILKYTSKYPPDKDLKSIVQFAKDIADVKRLLRHGEFGITLKRQWGLSNGAASKWIGIHKLFTARKDLFIEGKLPPEPRVLYEIYKLKDNLQEAIDVGIINESTTSTDIYAFRLALELMGS